MLLPAFFATQIDAPLKKHGKKARRSLLARGHSSGSLFCDSNQHTFKKAWQKGCQKNSQELEFFWQPFLRLKTLGGKCTPGFLRTLPPWGNFVGGRQPAGGRTEPYKLWILIYVVPLVDYWAPKNILTPIFSLLKVKKNAKNDKKYPPSKSGYFNKYLKC